MGTSRLSQNTDVGLNHDAAHRKYQLGKLRRARQLQAARHAHHSAQRMYECMASSHGTSRTRVVMEIFSRTGSASKRAPSFGYTAAAPLDSSVGVVLGSDDGKALCNRMIGSLRPLVLLPGIHCAPWLVINGNTNYSRRSEELQELRADECPNLEAAMDWCVQQHAEGRYFLFQSPVTSRIWAEDCVANMLRKTNGRWSDCHSRDYTMAAKIPNEIPP